MFGLRKSIWVVLLILFAGQLMAADRVGIIKYPLTARPALVEQGGSFTIQCDAVSSTSSWAVRISTPFITKNLSVNAVYNNASGMWTLTAQVPASVPFELYDLKVTATGIEGHAYHAVKVLPQYLDTYYFIHVPDMHIPSVYWIGTYDDDNSVPELLKVFEQIAIINPEFVLQTGDFVNNGKSESEYQLAQQLLYAAQVPMFLTGGNHDLWYDGHKYWKRYFSPVMDYSFNYGEHYYAGLEMYDIPTVTFTAEQMDWLQNDLRQSVNNNDKLRTLFYHYDQSNQIDDDFVDEYAIDLMVYGHTHVDNVGRKGARNAPNLNTSYTMDNRGAYRLIKVSGDRVESWPLLSMDNLKVDYSPANDGSNWQVTATVTNSNAVDFENGLIKFYVLHNTAGYTVTGGEVAQVVTTSSTDVYYVNVNIQANSVQTVSIVSNAPPANRPPRINSYDPATDVVVMAGQSKTFGVSASDPDGSSLNYTWYVDDVQVSNSGPQFNYESERWFTGMKTLRVKVSDGTYYDEHTWNVEITEYSKKPVLNFPSMEFLLHNEEAALSWQEAFDTPLNINFEYGLEPGRYTGSIPEMDNNTVYFTPEEEGMGLGVHYCRLSDGQVSSDPFTLVIESPVAPQMLHPIGNVQDLSPVFSWDRVPGVPYYVVICSDEEIIILEDGDTGEITVEGANPIWSLITSETSVTYGQPDPSGTYTSSAAPLIPGKSYWWIVLNCYGNVPELTSSVQSGISKFTVDLDPPDLGAPVLTFPADDAELAGETISFTWQAVENAKAYHFYPFKIEEEFGIESARGVWQTTITTTEPRYDFAASELLMKGRYRWKVAAVAGNGLEVMSDSRDFTYDAPSAELSIRTFYQQNEDGNIVNKPLPRVTIKYEALDGIYSDMPLSTDLHGQRLNYSISPGIYRMVLSKEGYDTLIDTLLVQEGQEYNQNYYLIASSSAINGRVVDANGNAVADAGVSAQHSLYTEIIRTTFTDAQGNFRLSVSPGPYLVAAEKTNYQPSDNVSISVNSGVEAVLEEDLVVTRNANLVSGKVVNSGQEPVFGVNVTLANGETFTSVTDADGQYSFSVPDGSYQLSADKQGFIAPAPRTITTAGGVPVQVTPDLVMQSNAGIILGYVKDGAHQLNDVTVKAFPLTGEFYETQTDDYGQFTFNVPGGTYTLTVEKSGYISQGEVQINVQSGGTQSGIGINMSPVQSTIKGKVTTDGYSPLQGVKIFNSSKSTLTSEGGQFELSVKAGTHVISAQKESFISSSPDTVTLLAGQVLEQINFILTPNASVIKGQITSQGSPVYNAKIKVTGEFDVETTSDEDGKYIINVSAGLWNIKVSKTGFVSITETGLNIGTGQALSNKNYELVPGSASINGTVISHLTGEALKNAQVKVRGTDMTSSTSSSGAFSLTVDPGNYNIDVSKTGYIALTKNTGDLAVNGNVGLTFELDPAESSFKGKLTDTRGAGLDEVTVMAIAGSDTVFGLSGADGSFRLDVKAGIYAVIAAKTGYKSITWGNQISINANETKDLAVKVMEDDRVTLTGMVQRVVNDDPVASAKVLARAASGFELQTLSASDGSFSFVDAQNNPLLVPDSYMVIVSKAGFTPDTLTGIVLASGQSLQVEAHIQKNEGFITGRTRAGGASLADVTVKAKFATTGEAYSTVSRSDGEFIIKSIPAGSYTLTANKVGYTSPQAQSVTTGNDFELVLTLNAGRIAGNVSDGANGNPIENVMLNASDGLGNFASAETDANGSFDLQRLPTVAGYSVQFVKSGYHSTALNSVSATNGKSLPITMDRITGSIAGTISDQSGSPMAGVVVSASSNNASQQVTTDANGNYGFSALPAEQYTLAALKVGFASDPVQQIVVLWQGGDTTGVDFVMQEATVAELKIQGPDLISNASQGSFTYTAKTSDQRQASIIPVWSVELVEAVESLDQNGLLDPVNDYVGQLVLRLSDQYSGMAVSKTLSITQELLPKNPDLSLTNRRGVELTIQDSCVTQNAVLQLRRPVLAASMKKDKQFTIVGDVFELSPAQFKFNKPATLSLPVPDGMDANACRAGRWNMDRLEWEAVESVNPGLGRISFPVTTLGRYAVMEQAQPLGISDIKFSPNPFSPLVAPLQIHFNLTSDQTTAPVVTIKIYNMVGDLVRILANGELMETGPVIKEWDGYTDHGNMALNGRYLVHFKIRDASGDKEELKTFVLIK